MGHTHAFGVPAAVEFAVLKRADSRNHSHKLAHICAVQIQQKHQQKRCKDTRVRRATSLFAVAAPEKPQQSVERPQLSATLSRHVAQLTVMKDHKPVQVYILGMSHVSRDSCKHTTQLIATVKPDLVLIELCKDRVGLLVDPALPQPQYWHTSVIKLQIANSTAQQPAVGHACDSLLTTMQCQSGKAFSAHQIEQDCTQLLASGMFGSVVPVTKQASQTDAPMFVCHNNQVS